MPCYTIPIRTHVITEQDDIVELARRYTEGVVEPGDIIAIAESVVAITQKRAILPEEVHPGLLARFLCRFPGKHGSLATPPAMELAIREAGTIRILLGCAAAVLGRLIGRRGFFYLVAGRELAFIDDIAGTMWPYERHIILGPYKPEKIASAIKKATGADVVIADVNDIKCVDILAATSSASARIAREALINNPFGNDDQQTPIVVIKIKKKAQGIAA
ncbi:coenzyme F420-0:L-glutamate ligase [Desulfofundulus thermocisternus]|uniref:coenzyme F420-0:L-glutamate ligase n=1 Tax=Desulfofundulus thermocisternus TaxID=42471 RepID=UPI0019EE1651|nr:coenzyme F420-0:L-glutamate ligase [Desulfofundulus thermocisternus]MBE3585552.1 coenzyme F420-0:L-glutamate ligase [Thermoanaerobacter sp.]MCS5696177.1 coenzyme F420-0:L-glutamate ligase [Desulfofundulus thermocisternus]